MATEENPVQDVKRIRTFNPETGKEFLAPVSMVNEYWSKMTGFIPIPEPSLGLATSETAKPHIINLDSAMEKPNPYAVAGNIITEIQKEAINEKVTNFEIVPTNMKATITFEDNANTEGLLTVNIPENSPVTQEKKNTKSSTRTTKK